MMKMLLFICILMLTSTVHGDDFSVDPENGVIPADDGDLEIFCNRTVIVTFKTPCLSCSLNDYTSCPNDDGQLMADNIISCVYTTKLDKNIIELRGKLIDIFI